MPNINTTNNAQDKSVPWSNYKPLFPFIVAGEGSESEDESDYESDDNIDPVPNSQSLIDSIDNVKKTLQKSKRLDGCCLIEYRNYKDSFFKPALKVMPSMPEGIKEYINPIYSCE